MIHRTASETHQHTGITPDHLRNCLQYLTDNNYVFVSLEAFIHSLNNQTPLPEKAVVFTMDDGFIDQAEVAAPIFLEFNCPLTFFVITGLLDQKLWPWDAQVSWIIDNSKQPFLDITFADETLHIELGNADKRSKARKQVRNILKELDAGQIPEMLNQLAGVAQVSVPATPPADYQPLNWEQARELETRGVRFAPHSVTHSILSKLDREAAMREIKDSWQTMKQELNNPLPVFCYPTGRVLDFGPREIDFLKKEGFLAATSTEPGYVKPDGNITEQMFRLPRFELPDNMTDFIQYCSWIEHAKEKIKTSTSFI